jgi:hypothetical protein
MAKPAFKAGETGASLRFAPRTAVRTVCAFDFGTRMAGLGMSIRANC